MNITQVWVLLAFVVILGAIILPIPALLLDVLLALSITFSLTVLTLTAFIKDPYGTFSLSIHTAFGNTP
jgi:flagellar biosynthesis protein FlhA